MARQWGWAAWAVLLGVPLAASEEPITAANWRRHPAIVEIRAIYQETKDAEVAGKLSKEHRTFEYCQACEDTEAPSISTQGAPSAATMPAAARTIPQPSLPITTIVTAA